MLVGNWMTTDVVTVCQDTPLMKASIIMREKNIRCLPVLNKNGKLAGILSDRDLKSASPSKATALDVYELNYLISTVSVESIMTKNLVIVRPDETVEFAAILMLENKISALPVINRTDALVGIVTQTDIFKALVNITGAYAGGTQFAFSLDDRPGSIQEVTDVIRDRGGRIISILSTKEMAEEGSHHVYIRTISLSQEKLGELVKVLETRFVILYAVRDLLDEAESRRIRIPG
jgi:acetoin utilization protein AcuB